MLHPEGKMVSFDIREGEVRGVRVGGEMFGRVGEGKGEPKKKAVAEGAKKDVVGGKGKAKAVAKTGGVKSGRVEKKESVVKGKKK